MIILRFTEVALLLAAMVGTFLIALLCFAVWPLGTAAAITLLVGDRR